MTDRKQRPSLAEFAKANGPQPCWVCSLPEREEIDAAASELHPETGRRVVSNTMISRWLRTECGYEQATMEKVKKHVERHVR